MKTSTTTNNSNVRISRTLSHVLVGALLLTALAFLMPSRSEAGLRVNARIGKVRVALNSNVCCPAPVLTSREVVVRSNSRKRIVVRNEYPRQSGCRGVVVSNNHHHRDHDKVWVPGHFETKVKRHGRLKKVWVPGRWVRV